MNLEAPFVGNADPVERGCDHPFERHRGLEHIEIMLADIVGELGINHPRRGI